MIVNCFLSCVDRLRIGFVKWSGFFEFQWVSMIFDDFQWFSVIFNAFDVFDEFSQRVSVWVQKTFRNSLLISEVVLITSLTDHARALTKWTQEAPRIHKNLFQLSISQTSRPELERTVWRMQLLILFFVMTDDGLQDAAWRCGLKMRLETVQLRTICIASKKFE